MKASTVAVDYEAVSMLTRFYANNFRTLVAFDVRFGSMTLFCNPSSSVFFWRDNHSSPTRIGSANIPNGLSFGEALIRGWVNGNGKVKEDA